MSDEKEKLTAEEVADLEAKAKAAPPICEPCAECGKCDCQYLADWRNIVLALIADLRETKEKLWQQIRHLSEQLVEARAALRERDAEVKRLQDLYKETVLENVHGAPRLKVERDRALDQLRIAREALEFYAHHCQSAPYNWGDNIGSYDVDTGEKARAALEKMGVKP